MTKESSHLAVGIRTFKGGKIIFQSPLLPYPTIMNCVIRDITEAGARFTCESRLSPPKDLGLIWTSANQMRDVRVVWIRDLDIGVEFTSGPRQAGLR